MNHIHNPNCDGDHCRSVAGEVRRLPHSTDPHHGASIVCRDCFNREIAFREERNRDLSPEARYDLPAWQSLEVYA